jgi:exosortase H (IPTLxxWG-CTERM-specific)
VNLAGWLGRLRARLGQHREALRFCLRFAAYSVVAFLLLQALEESVVVPFTRGIARAAYAILHALGAPVRLRGAVVMLPDFAVEIRNNCNAVYEIGLYAAATLAYPASAGRRLAGILLGGALLYLVNLVRVLTLIWVGALLPQSFDVAHVYVWQALFLVAVAGLWLAWVSRVRPLA